MSPLVYIILVNYNTCDDTIECIKSIKQIYYENYKIIVVDNASMDNSYDRLKNIFPNDLIINSNENLGFAGGNNIGIGKALENGAEYVLLLNNDTVVEKDFLNQLVSTFDENLNIGIVGCKINYYNKKDIINYAGGEILWEKFTTNFFRTDEKDDKTEEVKEITFVSGCAMMISEKVFNDIGVLDDSYFMYYEDTDFCAKASEKGYKLLYQPKSVIYHKISASSGGDLSPFVLYWSTKNRIKFKNKFAYKVSKKNSIYFDVFNLISRITRIVIYIFKGDTKKAKAILKGYVDGIKERGLI